MEKTIHQELSDFLHSPRRLLVAMGVLLFGSSIMLQWLYPTNLTMPFATVDGTSAGFVSKEVLLADLKQRYEQPTRFKTGSAVVATAKLSDMGITPNYEATVQAALEYPWWERMIPFSLFTRQWSMGEIPLRVTYDTERIRQFTQSTIMPKCNLEATSATIRVTGGTLVLDKGRQGRYCEARQIIRTLETAKIERNQPILLPHRVLFPARKTQEVEALFTALKQRFSAGITIDVEGAHHHIPAKEVIGWLIFREDSKTRQLKLAVDEAKLKGFLERFQKKFYKPAAPRTVYLLDGVEQRQEGGEEGRALDIAATQAAIRKLLLGGGTVTKATLQTVAPEIHYVNDYSFTSRGLEAFLQDLAREKGGYGITVIELDGRKRSANANGTVSFTTASTYKIFVAYAVLKEIEAGRMTWGQQIRAGMDTEACWEEMLIYSMNPCSRVFADMVGGWGRIEVQMHSLGLTNTYLNATDKRSTSNDEAMYFAKLEQGELLQGASRERLLNTFLHQHYKSGIPAGTGFAVANKIGFLDGYLHDIGIVYAPQGRYVLAIMTYGGTWWSIADVAQRVQSYLSR